MKGNRQVTADISANLRTPRCDNPVIMQGFPQLAQAATRTEGLVKLDARFGEVEEGLGMAVYVDGRPSLIHADTIGAFEQFSALTMQPVPWLAE